MLAAVVNWWTGEIELQRKPEVTLKVYRLPKPTPIEPIKAVEVAERKEFEYRTTAISLPKIVITAADDDLPPPLWAYRFNLTSNRLDVERKEYVVRLPAGPYGRPAMSRVVLAQVTRLGEADTAQRRRRRRRL